MKTQLSNYFIANAEMQDNDDLIKTQVEYTYIIKSKKIMHIFYEYNVCIFLKCEEFS